MGSNLQSLEALHGDMIAALLGTPKPLVERAAQWLTEAAQPAAQAVAGPVKATCSACGKRLRVDSKGGMCAECREKLPTRNCAGCGTPLRGASATGYCRS